MLCKVTLPAGPGREVAQEGHRRAAAAQRHLPQTLALPPAKTQRDRRRRHQWETPGGCLCRGRAGLGQHLALLQLSQYQLPPETSRFRPSRSRFSRSTRGASLALPERVRLLPAPCPGAGRGGRGQPLQPERAGFGHRGVCRVGGLPARPQEGITRRAGTQGTAAPPWP